MELSKLKNILEAILLGADRTLTVIQLEGLFELDEERPTRDEIRKALHEMAEDYETRGYELKQVASGFRLQVRQEYATWVGRLWEEKPARYTRALLETLALIAYRQPITRGEIEEVRGVSVSSNIIKTLLERDWIKVLGHKDVPGKPSLYGTTKEFLDYFNLKSLDQLPTLAEIKDLDSIHPELALDENAEKGEAGQTDEDSASDDSEGDDTVAEPQDEAAEQAESDDVSIEAANEDSIESAAAESDEDVVEQVINEDTEFQEETEAAADEEQQSEKQVSSV
jgi:segregation and condensation protein B